MTFQHKKLAEDRWNDLSLIEQMANLGSEIERSILWRKRGKKIYFKKAFERGLELLALTIDDPTVVLLINYGKAIFTLLIMRRGLSVRVGPVVYRQHTSMAWKSRGFNSPQVHQKNSKRLKKFGRLRDFC